MDINHPLKLRPRRTVVMTDAVSAALDDALRQFLEGRQWFDDHHLAYKVTVVLQGPSGTGKTSLIRMLATELNRDVYLLNLNKHGASLQQLLTSIPAGAIVGIEDFDDVRATHVRNEYDGGNATQRTDADVMSLSDILNALDGVSQLDDIIIVLTSNHIEKIDSALLRPGRVDAMIEVGELDDPAIHRYIALMYAPEAAQAVSHVRFAPTRGCVLHGHFLAHPHDAAGFIAALERAPERLPQPAE